MPDEGVVGAGVAVALVDVVAVEGGVAVAVDDAEDDVVVSPAGGVSGGV